MRRLLLAATVASAAACAAPAPCTQALCPVPGAGTYRVTGWTAPVTVKPDVPPVPIVSDSSVEVLNGPVVFSNRRSFLRAESGAAFRFEVSTAAARAAVVTVSSGAVSVALSSGAAGTPLVPGVPVMLESGR
jgi:hypothetical protein